MDTYTCIKTCFPPVAFEVRKSHLLSLFSSLEITFEDTFSILECLDLTSGKNDIFFILLNGQIDGDYKNMLLHSNFGNNYQTYFLSIILYFH